MQTPSLGGLLLPVKRKVFLSFHHQDEFYKDEFLRLYGEHFISVAVDQGDINPDNSTDYIKRLIQTENIVQSSMVFALYGAETHKRKYVDWELYGALSGKVGGHKGLAIVLLPTFPQAPFNSLGQYDVTLIYKHLHPRIVKNIKSGYVDVYFWPGHYNQYNPRIVEVKDIIEAGVKKRETHNHLIDNSDLQYVNNLP